MKKSQSGNSKSSLSHLVWNEISSSVVIFAILIVTVILSTYLLITGTQKSKTLKEKTTLMARTLNMSLSSSDWTLALDHLVTAVDRGGLSEVSLSTASGEKIAGPLRSAKLSLFQICNVMPLSGNTISFRACLPLISKAEILTIAVILLLTVLAIFLLNKLFTKSASKIISRLSAHFASMRYAIDGNSNRSGIAGDLDFIETKEIVTEIERLVNEARLTQADRTRSELVAQIVHDIRSPLTALNVVQRHPSINANSEISQLLTGAIQKIENLSAELLKHYRGVQEVNSPIAIGENKNELNMVLAAIEEALNEKKSNQLTQKIAVESRLQRADGDVFLNVLAAQRIMDNLILNAMQAISDKDGLITVDGRYDKGSQFYVVSVTDNGLGIETDDIPLIFTRGFTKNKKNGTGLGLHFVKSTVEAVGGSVAVRSKVGVGTQFEIRIPVMNVREGGLHAST